MTGVLQRVDGMAAVRARMAELSAPPARVTELQGRFAGLLSDRIGRATASATAQGSSVPAGTDGGATASGDATPMVRVVTSRSTVPAVSTGATDTAGDASVPASGTAVTSWMQASALTEPRVTRGAANGGSWSFGTSPGSIAPVTPRGDWVSRIPNQRGRDLAPSIQAVADRYQLDPAFLAAVFWTESAYQADAVSGAGAVGLGQLMPETAATLGVDPWDPAQNMEGSARLYRGLLDRYDGDLELAISAYACGVGAVAKAGGVPSDFARDYITLLLGRRDYLDGVREDAP